MAENDDRSWIFEGADVALLTTGGATGTTVTVTKVEKLTSAQIVLSNDRRFRRKDLKEVGDSLRSGYGPRTELRSLDSPEVRGVLARQRVRRLSSEVAAQFGALPSSASVGEVLELLDSIERQVTGVRKAVARLMTKED